MKKLYIKFYSSCPAEQNTIGYPDYFPWQVREADITTPLEDGEVAMTYSEYANYLETRKTDMDQFIQTTENAESLEVYKQLKADEIYNACDYEMKERNVGIISSYINKRIDCREIDVLRNNQLMLMIEEEEKTAEPLTYICYDNSFEPITYQILRKIHAELTRNIMSMLYLKHELYAQLWNSACDSKEKIDEIQWSWTQQ